MIALVLGGIIIIGLLVMMVCVRFYDKVLWNKPDAVSCCAFLTTLFIIENIVVILMLRRP